MCPSLSLSLSVITPSDVGSSQLKSRNKRYEQAWTWGTVIKELEIKNKRIQLKIKEKIYSNDKLEYKI